MRTIITKRNKWEVRISQNGPSFCVAYLCVCLHIQWQCKGNMRVSDDPGSWVKMNLPRNVKWSVDKRRNIELGRKGYNADVHVIDLDTIIYMPQKFDNHALVVTQAEIQRWKQLNINYMSDEHDDQDPQVVLLHQSQWRSKSESYNLCTRNWIAMCLCRSYTLPSSWWSIRWEGQSWQRSSREELGV